MQNIQIFSLKFSEKQTKKIKIDYKTLNIQTIMKKQITFTRWHRYDMNGVKHIKRFELGVTPTTIPDEGYTEWTRGTGDFSDDALNNLRNGIQRACKGVPKPPEQKRKMSLAKLGVPKTEQHKQSMRESWHRRKQRELDAQTNSTTNSQTV